MQSVDYISLISARAIVINYSLSSKCAKNKKRQLSGRMKEQGGI